MKKEGFKQYYVLTFLIGLGFFTMGLMDPLYDSYIPVFLKIYLESDFLAGGIMAIDNIFAIFLIPVFSALSDRTRTPIGRRMPYILVTLPASAILFGLLPGSAMISLTLLILAIFALNLFKQAARGPVVALMPDIIPGDYRSEANGVINTMGGLAAIIGTVGLARLYDVDMKLPLIGCSLKEVVSSTGETINIGLLPFLLTMVLVILAVLLLFFFVKEKNHSSEKNDEKVSVWQSIKLVFGSGDKSAILILMALLFWFIGYQGMLPWVTRYAIEFLEMSPGTAPLTSGAVGIAYALAAIPSGYIAHRIGRKKTISVSLIVLAVITAVLFLHNPVCQTLGVSGMIRIVSFCALLFIYGLFWVAVITNSFPMLWQMASFGNIGIYTGLYYFFSQLAGTLAPAWTGFLRDLMGDRIMFLNGSLCFLLALAMMNRVKGGEPEHK